MRFTVSFILLGLLILSFYIFFAISQNDCDEQLLVSDKCLRKLLYIGDWNLTFIRNEKDILNFCSDAKKYFGCFKSFQRCLRSIPREIFNILTKNARALYKEECESPQKRQAFQKITSCLDETTLHINTCMDKIIVLLNYIANNLTGNQTELLRATCCATHISFQCFINKIQGKCEEKIGINIEEIFNSKIKLIASDVLQFTCSYYQTLEKCERNAPELIKSYASIINDDAIEKQTTSVLIPLIKIAKKIKF